MSYGPVQVFNIATMASDATLSAAIDLSKSFNKLSLVIPSMTSGTDIYIKAAPTLTGTYMRVFHPPSASTSVVGAWFVGSAVTNCIVPINNTNLQFVKVEFSTAMTASTANFKIICSD